MNPDPITIWYLDGKAAGVAGMKVADCSFGVKDWRRSDWMAGYWAGVNERKRGAEERQEEPDLDPLVREIAKHGPSPEERQESRR